MNVQRTECVEETFENVRHLTKALYSVLVEQGKISEQELSTYFAQEEKNEVTNHAKRSPVMELNCNRCGRKAIVRLDRDTKCMFCGSVLDPQKDRADTTTTDKSSQETLFSCQVVEEDLGQRSFFVGTSPKDDSVEQLMNEKEKHRNSSYMRDNPTLQFTASAVALGVANVIINNQASGIPIDPKKDYLGRMNRKTERLCRALKILWQIISKARADQGQRFFETLSNVNTAKIEGKTSDAQMIVACPHCQTENLRTDLFYVSCTSCTKEIALPILPGFRVYYPSREEPVGHPVPRKRRKEYLYSLFEAMFDYAADTFGLSWEDLTKIVQRDFNKCEDRKENEPRICAHCGRPIPETSQIGNRCLYCGKANGESAFERFL